MVVFNVTVEVEECTNENRGGAYVSVGVGGYRDITAVFVQPICGCECEDLIVQVSNINSDYNCFSWNVSVMRHTVVSYSTKLNPKE